MNPFPSTFTLTPQAALDRCRDSGRGQLIVLSGGRGAGKTSWCLALTCLARRRGLTVAGLVSPAAFCDGCKTAIDLQDLGSGETRRLAERPGPNAPGTAGLGWRFDRATLAWGNDLIERTAASDLLVIDEMGPLEFAGQDGFTAGFAAIDACRYCLAVVVVRPELLREALRRWPRAQVVEPADTPIQA